MHLPVSSIFICAAAAWILALSVLTMITRVQEKVDLGEGKSPKLLRAIRAQANAVEYLPIFGLLLILAEVQGAAQLPLQLLGATMMLGRVLHAASLLIVEPKYKHLNVRIPGMMLTWLSLGAATGLVFAITTGLL